MQLACVWECCPAYFEGGRCLFSLRSPCIVLYLSAVGVLHCVSAVLWAVLGCESVSSKCSWWCRHRCRHQNNAQKASLTFMLIPHVFPHPSCKNEMRELGDTTVCIQGDQLWLRGEGGETLRPQAPEPDAGPLAEGGGRGGGTELFAFIPNCALKLPICSPNAVMWWIWIWFNNWTPLG